MPQQIHLTVGCTALSTMDGKKILETPVYKRKRENKIKILGITTYVHATERKWKL